MKLALISDIHANLEALEAVLKDIEVQGVDRVHCLGDVIGYGSDPSACLELVQNHCDIKLMGNHEYAVLGLVPGSHLNQLARQSMDWTSLQMTERDIAIIADFDMTAEDEGCFLVHASPNQPDEWHYVLSEVEAQEAFEYFHEKAAFYGHTHLPLIFSQAGSAEIHSQIGHSIDLDTESDVRYLINIGSVGQPRDDDPSACYVVFDPQEWSVHYRRVAYDIGTAQAKMAKAHLPQALIERLEVGR